MPLIPIHCGMAGYSERYHEQEQNAQEAFSRFSMRSAASDGDVSLVSWFEPQMIILGYEKR